MISLGRNTRGLGFFQVACLISLLIFSVIYLSLSFNSRSDKSFLRRRRIWSEKQQELLTLQSSAPVVKDSQNSTLGFQKIFAISLPRRPDRRDGLALAAAYTGLSIQFIDGVLPEHVEKASMPGGGDAGLGGPGLGKWRAHNNALRRMVEEGISSALILEDNADWDLRVKSQLSDFAHASRALTQPLKKDSSTFADPTYPERKDSNSKAPKPLWFQDLPKTTNPKVSPYGDNWDVLNLGHCGVHSPLSEGGDHFVDSTKHIPKGFVLSGKDPTVPEPTYLHSFDDRGYEPFRQYEPGVNHTRIVHHSSRVMCTTAYAITQKGARRLLHFSSIGAELAVPFRMMMHNFCDQRPEAGSRPTCLTTQPPYFYHHHSREYKKDNEIGNQFGVQPLSQEEERKRQAKTMNIRLSARMNLDRLTKGRADFIDQWPDTNTEAESNIGDNVDGVAEDGEWMEQIVDSEDDYPEPEDQSNDKSK